MLQRTLALLGAGALAGAVAAAGTMPALTTFLAGVSPFDPIAFASAAVVLVLVGLVATYVPVRRASLVDPMHALRHE
jgi:ABC-type antimicrobial peptide transport system permease subunit